MSASKLECCCGRGDCAYLEHNSAALAELERDVETAARLGQVRMQAALLAHVGRIIFGHSEYISTLHSSDV